jgi:hypothetical protein
MMENLNGLGAAQKIFLPEIFLPHSWFFKPAHHRRFGAWKCGRRPTHLIEAAALWSDSETCRLDPNLEGKLNLVASKQSLSRQRGSNRAW